MVGFQFERFLFINPFIVMTSCGVSFYRNEIILFNVRRKFCTLKIMISNKTKFLLAREVCFSILFLSFVLAYTFFLLL